MKTENNLRIIIIDDNPEVHQDFKKILSLDTRDDNALMNLKQALFDEKIQEKNLSPNFTIDSAMQGEEGIELVLSAKNSNKPYAVAFVDIRMPPGLDGIETIQQIWTIDKEIQIVICTAYSDYSWEKMQKIFGDHENLLVLKKPIDAITIRQLAIALTKKWQLLQEIKAYTGELEKKVKIRTRSLEESLSIAKGTLESSNDGILVLNNKNQIINYNEKLIKMWEIPKKMLASKNGEDLINYLTEYFQNKERFCIIIKDLKTNPETIFLETMITLNEQIIEINSHPYKTNKNIAGRIWNFRDITKHAELEKKIEFQKNHDNLTQLPNRNFLNSHLSQKIKYSKSKNQKIGILLIDLDRFKLINDSFGSSTGDKLIIQFVERLKENIRYNDFIARWGGDEFILIIPNMDSIDALHNFSDKLFKKIKTGYYLKNHVIYLSFSIGGSVFPDDATTTHSLIQNADIAMHQAKELGGEQCQFYTKKLEKQSLKRLEMEGKLHDAIKNKEFVLYYQTQNNILTKKVDAIEALIRWKRLKKRIIEPKSFLPLIEKMGLSTLLGEWVFRTACEQNKKWQEMGFPPVCIAVNMSGQQFKQPNLIKTIKNILKDTKLDPQYLEIELSENILFNYNDAIRKLNDLKKLGIKIVIDDFGTGYTTLDNLKRLPLDKLKIDKSFIKNIGEVIGDEVIIQSVITMAKTLNLIVTAEGVETKKQFDFLKKHHCDIVQGFYFSVPSPPNKIEKQFQQHKKG